MRPIFIYSEGYSRSARIYAAERRTYAKSNFRRCQTHLKWLRTLAFCHLRRRANLSWRTKHRFETVSTNLDLEDAEEWGVPA